MNSVKREKRLIKTFLTEYQKLIEERTGQKFHPRHLAILAQPNLENSDTFEWIAYHKWFDEIEIGVSHSANHNIIEAFLEMPIHILIQAEELGKPLLSKEDQKKLAKALKLISELEMHVK